MCMYAVLMMIIIMQSLQSLETCFCVTIYSKATLTLGLPNQVQENGLSPGPNEIGRCQPIGVGF